MTPEAQQQQDAKQVKQWLDAMPAVVSETLVRKAKELTTTLIENDDPSIDESQIKADIRAIQAFVNNLAHWATIKG